MKMNENILFIAHFFAFVCAGDSPMVIDSSDDEDLDCAKETAPEIHDIDSGNDIFSCSEYASEIFQNLKQSEVHIFIFYPSV